MLFGSEPKCLSGSTMVYGEPLQVTPVAVKDSNLCFSPVLLGQANILPNCRI